MPDSLPAVPFARPRASSAAPVADHYFEERTAFFAHYFHGNCFEIPFDYGFYLLLPFLWRAGQTLFDRVIFRFVVGLELFHALETTEREKGSGIWSKP